MTLTAQSRQAPAQISTHRTGIVAVVVAGIAWILTLPPILVRTPVPSIVLGLPGRRSPACRRPAGSRSIDGLGPAPSAWA